jgi:hypothetical protein
VSRENKERSARVHIRCAVDGEPARVLLELRRRGIIRSNADAVCQGLLALWEKAVRRELEEARLMASKRLEQEE